MATVKIITVKESTWRGSREEWTNGWTFSSEDIAASADRLALINAVWDIEKLFTATGNGNNTVLRRAYYYNDINGTSDESWVFPNYNETGPKLPLGTGTQATSGNVPPFESCFLIKSKAGKGAKGRPVYISKFIHGALATSDEDLAAGITPAGTSALAKLTDGTLPGGAKVCRPNGVLAEGFVLDRFMRHHTLKRRGKRPSR